MKLRSFAVMGLVVALVGCGSESGDAGEGGGDGSGNGSGSGKGTGAGAGEPGCEDGDGDGFGEGCSDGPDCDDAAATCAADCEDEDTNGTADCADVLGAGLLLYVGANGGGPDHDPEAVEALYAGAGVPVLLATSLPAGFLDSYGTFVLLNARDTVPADVVVAGRHLLRRGGRVVSVVDHSGYGGHDEAAAMLAAIGSTMRSLPTLESGLLELVVTPAPPITDGISSIRPYWSASVDLGSGRALGATAAGYVSIGYEEVERGEVVIIGDASMWGYSLDEGDNEQFILNLALH